MSISTSYSAPGVLQTTFSSHNAEVTTTSTSSREQPTNDYLERVKKSQFIL